MADETTSVHVRITGRVQGVGYRAFVESNASWLQLDGWVRNRRDGTVEAVFQGPAAEVAEMLDRCRTGPPSAVVAQVDVIGRGVGVSQGFEVLPTA